MVNGPLQNTVKSKHQLIHRSANYGVCQLWKRINYNCQFKKEVEATIMLYIRSKTVLVDGSECKVALFWFFIAAILEPIHL